VDKQVFTALAGVLVGGAITIAGNLFLELFRNAGRARQLAHAVAGEISAVLWLLDRRQYIPGIKAAAETARAGQRKELKISVKESYFPTIEANLNSIGLLPSDLPLLIPKFLTLSKAVLEDFAQLLEMNVGHITPQELAIYLDDLAALMEEANLAGMQVVTSVAAFYGSPNGRMPWALHVRLFARRLLRRSHQST
jgi:hypothetical protein